MKQLFAKKRYIVSIFLTILITFCGHSLAYGNNAPVFTDGASTTRAIAENTASGQSIGSAVAATDADNDTLTYSLSGTDAASFSIVRTSGQLQTNAALDHETKSSYAVTVSVSDGNGGSDGIPVRIDITNVNEKPAFAPGGVILSVAENTASGTNIGDPFEATDPDSGDTLTYSLQRGDKDAFRIDPNTGQLRTHAALDYETKRFYTDLAVRATDSTGLVGSVRVTINVKDVDENRAPVFTDGSSTERTIAENTASGQNIGTAVAATDADNDTLIYTLGGDPDAASFSIVRTSGQLQTRAALDYETKASYSVTVSVSDGNGGSDSITVTIDVQDVPEITPPLSERTPQVRDAIIAKLRRVSNANDVTPAHLAAIRTLDVSNKKITALKTGDFNGLTALSTLDLGWNSIRDISALAGLTSVTELFLHANSISDISALEDLTSLTQLSLNSNSISDISALAGLTSLTRLDLPYNSISDISVLEGLTSLRELYLNNNSISDISALEDLTSLRYLYLKGNSISEYGPLRRLKAAIAVIEGHRGLTLDITIPEVRSPNNAPVFTDGGSATRSVAENTASGENIGAAIAATDADTDDTLTYTLSGDPDAGAFRIVSTSGQLQTRAALDYETKSSYTVSVSVSDGKGGSDSITVTITVTDVAENNAPVFTDGVATTRSIAENTASGQNIGTAVAATDADNDTLTYTLGGTDAASFSIVRTSGQLQTNAALDYETKTSYAVRITTSDGTLTDIIDVTINVTNVNETPNNNAPIFTDGTSTTRTVAETAAVGATIGASVAATDSDPADTLTYSLGGTDAAVFSIASTTGQLYTSTALDYGTKTAYAVTVSVFDSKGGSDSIAVTISVTDVDQPPVFTEGTTATRLVAESAPPETNIGAPVAATDPDGDTLRYELWDRFGTNPDDDAFSVDSTSGQIKTKAPLDYETKSAYQFTLAAFDSGGYGDYIAVTINVTNANDAPTFTEGATATRLVAENTAAGTNIGTPIAATDVDPNTTLVYTLDGTDAAAFSIASTLGQLQTKAALDYETKNSYSVRITASDGSLTDTIDVTIDVTDVNEIGNDQPTFIDGSSTTRAIAENTAAGQNIGAAVGATDPDRDTLAYTLGGADAAAFSIVRTTGQLQTSAALDCETQLSYSVTVSVSDGNGGSDSIAVTIDVTNVNEAPPIFTDGATATRLVAENTAAGTNIGTPVAATDADCNDTLTYFVWDPRNTTPDDDAFSIDSTSGQIKTKAPLDYETKSSYQFRFVVRDEEGRADDITVTISVTNANDMPTFTEGTTTTRLVMGNIPAGRHIGMPVAATDVDNDTLTYTLDGADAASFSIVSTTGQLQTKAALDYETQNSYSVTVSVSDSNGGSDSIAVTINVTDPDTNTAPVFTDGATTTRSVEESVYGSSIGTNIGTPIAATDADTGDVLTYSLGGTDAAAFSIVSTTGQLRASVDLDYETRNAYAVTVSVFDSKGGSDSIAVTIDVTDVNDPPVFTEGTTATRTIAESAPPETNIGAPVAATDQEGHTLRYMFNFLSNNPDRNAFSIDSTTGQIKTTAALDYETKTSYRVVLFVEDSGHTYGEIVVTIDVTDVDEINNTAPVFTDGTTTTRAVAENMAPGTNIGEPVAATDANNDTLTYSLVGTDAALFSIVSTTGQLQTRTALDYETKNSYSVRINVSDDGSLTDSITVTINVSNVNEAPIFTEGATATRTIAESAPLETNIGAPVAATDVDAYTTLTYTLDGADAASFSILSTTGQLQTNAALDYETDTSHSVTVSVSDDNGGSDSIAVTIDVTDVDEISNTAPVFTEGTTTTRAVAENTAAGENIGTPVAATDADNDVLTYTLGGTDASSFSIVSTTGQLQTNAALDFESSKTSYSIIVKVSDSSLTDSITVTIDVTDVNEPPVFTEGATATRTIAENTAAGENIGAPVAATDVDANTTLIYTLGGTDAASFSIVSTTGQLQTSAALDYETQNSYSVTVSVSDSNSGSDNIAVTINVNAVPVFTDGASTTRSVEENTSSYSIGTPVAATDADNDTLTYTLGGTDAASFRIVSTTGQLLTNGAMDHETDDSYAVTVSVSDGNGGSDSIAVTISVTDVNDLPVFTEGTTATRTVAEGNTIGANIGEPVAATDQDGDTLEYMFWDFFGTNPDDDAFSIDSTTGQIRTKAPLDYETKNSYRFAVGVNDSGHSYPDILVTINVTDVDESNNNAPVFPGDTTTTFSVPEHTAAETNIGTPVTATDADTGDTLTYSLGGADAALFSIVSTTGQLQTKAALDYEASFEASKTSYSVAVNVSDDGGLTDGIAVTITVTDVDEPGNDRPLFTERGWVRRYVAENTASGQNIGSAFTVTDSDADDTLIYSLVGTGAASFSIVSTTGQLQTKAALDRETKSYYNVTVSVSDGNGGSDSITVYISVTNVNEDPSFTEGSSATRTVAENTDAGENIGDPVAATDVDRYSVLTYSLDGTDAASFSIVSTSGQLQTSAALDYEIKTSYSVTITVSDRYGGSDSIDVTIDVTDIAAAAPSVETPPLIPENTGLLTNYPNPFNPETWIPYQLAEPAEVTLTIYDVRGVVVRRLDLGYQAAGFYHSRSRAIHWDGRNGVGEKVASGLYFYTFTAGDFTATRKLLIRK